MQVFLADTLQEMDVHARIREARRRLNLTEKQFADHVGVSRGSVQQWEKGVTAPNRTRQIVVAEFLGITVAELMGAPLSKLPEVDIDNIVIPQYEIGGGMGHGRLLLEAEPPGRIKSWTVDNDWLRRNVSNHTGAKNLCIVTGFGPSMRPMYNPGDPLLVDAGVKKCEEDAVFFFRWREHGFIKMLQRIPSADGLIIRAKSKNPDYESFDMKIDGDFQVLAKVLTVWKSEQF